MELDVLPIIEELDGLLKVMIPLIVGTTGIRLVWKFLSSCLLTPEEKETLHVELKETLHTEAKVDNPIGFENTYVPDYCKEDD